MPRATQEANGGAPPGLDRVDGAVMRATVDMPHRLAPHSLEAERALLGCVLQAFVPAERLLEELADDDFYKDSHRMIYAGVRRLHQEGGPASVVAVVNELRRTDDLEAIGGPAYL